MKSAVAAVVCVLAACCRVPLSGQAMDSLAMPQEFFLNMRQPPDLVLKTIGIKPGMAIGEVGAGRGRVAVQIASRIGPTGRLYANDVDQAALQFLEKRCARSGWSHVKTVLGTVTDPKLPAGELDMVVMVNVVHCLEKPVELLRAIGSSLKPGGKIVIVEGNLDKDPSAAGEWFSRSKLLTIYQDAGYVLDREETFLPKDNIYFLAKNNPAK